MILGMGRALCESAEKWKCKKCTSESASRLNAQPEISGLDQHFGAFDALSSYYTEFYSYALNTLQSAELLLM